MLGWDPQTHATQILSFTSLWGEPAGPPTSDLGVALEDVGVRFVHVTLNDGGVNGEYNV